MGILDLVVSALVTSAVLMSASVGAVEAASTAPDLYTTKINTKTVVTTPTPIRTNTAVDILVKVTANSPDTPKGETTLKLSPAPAVRVSRGRLRPALRTGRTIQ